MRDPQNKRNILNIASNLFLEKGYAKTSMREIAKRSEVSLGLVVYYYKTKKQLAIDFILLQFKMFKKIIQEYVDLETEPILFSAVLIKLNHTVMVSPKYYQFYLDVLKEDVYFEMMKSTGLETDKKITEWLNISIDDETLLLYGSYIPASLERTLMLFNTKKMDCNEVADLIFKSSIQYISPDSIDYAKYSYNSTFVVERIIRDHPEVFDLYKLT